MFASDRTLTTPNAAHEQHPRAVVLFQVIDIYDGDDLGKFIIESTFRNSAHHRHLPAFEAAFRRRTGT
jgi:hypothetical protein